MLPVLEAQMLIRRSADIVFEAFVDPSITTHFWFSKSSGRLEQGRTVTWEWEMYGVSAEVYTQRMVPNELIQIQWGDPVTKVDFVFQPLSESTTYVIIKNYDFTESGDLLMATMLDSMGGFTTVLDGMKAYLEHGLHLNLIRDKFPQNLIDAKDRL